MNNIDFAQVLQSSFGLILDALPGITSVRFTRYSSGREGISFDTDNEEALAALAKLFDVSLEVVTLDAKDATAGQPAWWRRAVVVHEQLTIEMSGPHYRGEVVTFDAEAIATAAVKAGAAVTEAQVQP